MASCYETRFKFTRFQKKMAGVRPRDPFTLGRFSSVRNQQGKQCKDHQCGQEVPSMAGTEDDVVDGGG